MTSTANKKWNDEAVAKLNEIVNGESPVSAATVNAAAEALGTSPRSVASKLRQLDIEVASMAKEKAPAFTEEEGASLAAFVQNNANTFTYAQIAEAFSGGKFTSKQVQGKILALELTSLVKPTEKVEAARTYTEAEEATVIQMANAGAFLEDIAAAVGKSVASVRGKALSLTRSEHIKAIPAQKESHAKDQVDPIDALGDKIFTMTVEEIAAATDKTPRGIKTALTRRGISCKDHDGAAKRAKADEKVAA